MYYMSLLNIFHLKGQMKEEEKKNSGTEYNKKKFKDFLTGVFITGFLIKALPYWGNKQKNLSCTRIKICISVTFSNVLFKDLLF